MNAEERKRLEDIQNRPIHDVYNDDIDWLVSRLEAEAAEVERLALVAVGWQKRAEAAESNAKHWAGLASLYQPQAVAAESLAAQERKRADRAEGELRKWTRPHDDGDLQVMKEQSDGSHSLAAQQAYINALVQHLAQAKARIEALGGCVREARDSLRMEHDDYIKRHSAHKFRPTCYACALLARLDAALAEAQARGPEGGR